MAHFVEQYTHMLQQCSDFDSLASAVDVCISKNVLNHVSTDIKEAIDRLYLDTPFDKFLKTMVVASTTSDHSETTLNLLIHFCNRVTKEFNTLLIEPDDFALLVLTICADDKQFITRLTDTQKDLISDTLVTWYLVRTQSDKENIDRQHESLRSSMELILQGKISMEELDRAFSQRYKDITLSKVGTSYAHPVNEIIRPFQALFINIVQNINRAGLLNGLCRKRWFDYLDEVLRGKAELYKSKFNKGGTEDYLMILNDFVYLFKTLNDELSTTGYDNIENPVVGRCIWNFITGLHTHYEAGDFSAPEIALLLREAQRILYNSFSITDTTRNIINLIVRSYCDTGDYESALLRCEYKTAIRLFLERDEMFNLWREEMVENNATMEFDRVLATYLACYVNPIYDKATKLIKATEAIGDKIWKRKKKEQDLEEDPREDEEENRPEDTKEESEDSDNEDQESDEEPYDGPEIDARQSNKGYSRFSKVQADADRKIYKAYKKYKNNEEKVDSQLVKMLDAAKRAFTQDKTEEIIEGKKFTPIGILKKVLKTAAIFSYSKVHGIVYLVVSHTLSKKRTERQRNEILTQIDEEIKMLDEKIEDARSDGNRKAKYSLMRTRSELVRARDKIKYNLTATKKDLDTARSYIYRDKNRPVDD